MAAPIAFAWLLLAAPASDRLPAPVEARDADIVIPVSESVRAATLSRMPQPPARPVTVSLACDISLYNGEPRRCVPAQSLPQLRTWSDFYAAAGAFGEKLEAPGADAAVRAAFERVRVLRVRRPAAVTRDERKLMLFTQVVSASDAMPALPAAERLEAADVTLADQPGDFRAWDLYPEVALRNEDQATVSVLCRVRPDGGLLCRDARVTWFSSKPIATDRLFELVTYQMMSLRKVGPLARDGRPTAGRDLATRVGWRLGGS